MSDWTCSSCGAAIEDSENLLDKPYQGCPKCGSRARTAHVSSHVTASTNVRLKTHSKHREGGSKVVRELIEGDDFHRKTGRWNIIRRLIDRKNNWYEEHFQERETGKTIHTKAEPLSEHRHKPRTP
jgi:predicted  nucleic acid-binding Zn-ribbon protein